jgi:class 3 adenylate cyclase
MAVCQGCGEANPERARFCLACGALLAAAARVRREERKRVSVLFCDLVGFTARSERLDVEDVRGLLAPYYQRLRADLEGHGGTVEKFIGDAVMALFGAPTAHEDDPERAVRAALSIRETIADLNQADPTLELRVRMGVTTGEALVVLDARPVEGEGMASGDVVNTAARLQAAAPVDGILVDAATMRATDRQLSYQPADPVAAKGKAAPVLVWLVEGARASLGVDVDQAPVTALVGRERERDLLAHALGRVRAEQAPQLVTLVGVPGMGKSRLVWELGQLVEGEPELTSWRQGRCLPYGEGVALWALGEIVKAQAGILDSDPAEKATSKLTQAVTDLLPDAEERAWVGGHLAPLIGLGGIDELAGDRRGEAFTAWRRFLEALAEQGPTVLVIEDLHWADELLLDFLDHLVEWATDVPLLIIATARPELLSRRPGWGGGKPNSTIVSLAPLTDQDTSRLVGGLLGQALLPAEVQTALLARSGGNPLYAEEYVRMLADRGYLFKAGGSWRLEQTSELPLPESVEGIIAARLDALEPEEKALVQDAAVLGKVGWLGALGALADSVEAGVLEQRLHALERRELFRRERRSQVAGERQYAFRHVLIRDVAYGQLPRAARVAKHQRVARWLQDLSPDRAEDRAELLAHHYHAALTYAHATGQATADLTVQARLAMAEAGDRALALYARTAAARWYEKALELWPTDDPGRPPLLLHLGEARVYSDETGGELVQEARDALLVQGDNEGAAQAEQLLSVLAGRRGDGDGMMRHAHRAAALMEQAPPSPAKAQVLVNLAGAFMMSGASEKTIRAARQALAMAERLGLTRQRAWALSYIGTARIDRGDRGGLADMHQAVSIAVEANLPASATLYGNLGDTTIGLGELERGFALQAKAREWAERFGLLGELRWSRAEQIYQNYWQGHWDDALTGADKFLSEVEAGSPHIMERSCRLGRGLLRLARGNMSGALADSAIAVERAAQMGTPEVLLPTLALHAHILTAAGQADQASATIDEALAALAEHGPLPTNPDWSGPLATALQRLGRGSELTRLTAEVTSPTAWLQAATAVARGDYEQAADTYAKIGALPDEAYAHLRAAEQLLANGHPTEANLQLRDALAFYRQVQATGYLREAQALAAASA